MSDYGIRYNVGAIVYRPLTAIYIIIKLAKVSCNLRSNDVWIAKIRIASPLGGGSQGETLAGR